MRNWLNAEVVELSLSETNYGGKSTTKFDDVYVNAEGKYEATFVES